MVKQQTVAELTQRIRELLQDNCIFQLRRGSCTAAGCAGRATAALITITAALKRGVKQRSAQMDGWEGGSRTAVVGGGAERRLGQCGVDIRTRVACSERRGLLCLPEAFHALLGELVLFRGSKTHRGWWAGLGEQLVAGRKKKSLAAFHAPFSWGQS